jgi:hypothetical protein
LDGDHLDLTYRDRDAWPSLTPAGSLKSFAFDIGDPVAGPTVLLGLVTKVEGEDLDWRHSVDPVHHHGTDQFRVIMGGEWMLAGKPMAAGAYGFQEAGWVYQEHPIHGGPVWTLTMMADRRGARATLKLEKDLTTVIEGGELGAAYGAPVESEPYPHPAGDKGLAAVATTLGPCERGYLSGRLADLGANDTPQAVTAVLGDEKAGPVVHVLKAAPNETVAPACIYPTELVLSVVAGSCRVGATEYQAGDIRVQGADARMDAVVAGPDGVQAVLVVADRRASPSVDGAAPDWMNEARGVLRGLEPVPGGVAGHRRRAAAARS